MTKTDLSGAVGALPALLDGARALSDRYPVWLCDVWGVVHDGVTPFSLACQALMAHRRNGGTVVLITNAPRPSHAILPQLQAMKVPPDCFDAIVSSGDVTRSLVAAERGRNVFHLGPAKDLALIEGMPVNFTAPEEAEVILCSGLMDDEAEQPEDYRQMLSEFAGRDLPMICANPDKVVRKGAQLLPCGGALAEIYQQLGGTVAMAGKPYPPIYDECLRIAADIRNQQVAQTDVLAIGDGMATDVKGAADNGLQMLFIVNGIHEYELATHGEQALVSLIAQKAPVSCIAGIMPGLAW